MHIQMHKNCCSSCSRVEAHSMYRKYRHNDVMLTLQIDADADSIYKFSTGANEVLLCGASVSRMP